MNENHAKLMPSPEWAAHIQDEVLPLATEGVELGADLLELGPGPGAATEWLRHRVGRLIAVEREEDAVARLIGRFAGTNVEAMPGDAAALGFPDASFDTVATCTMLHHVPTRALQDKVLAEAHGRHLPGLGQPAQRRPAPVPRGRHIQPGRAGRVPDPAAGRRLRRDHAESRLQPHLHRAQEGRLLTARLAGSMLHRAAGNRHDAPSSRLPGDAGTGRRDGRGGQDSRERGAGP
jgi:SAM-dependent methyltransferase